MGEIFDWEVPNYIESLVLSKLHTNFVVMQKLTHEMCKMGDLKKLVMQDLSLEDTLAPCHVGDTCEDHTIGRNLVKFVDMQENIENL